MKAAVILLGAVILLWPTVVNRGPFFLADTTSYVRGGDAAAYQLFGAKTDWTGRFFDRYQPQQKPAPEMIARPATGDGPPVTLAGRSIYYGAFLYVADGIAGLSFAAALQALLAAVCIFWTVDRFSRRSISTFRPFLLVTVFLAIASSAAYFTGYLTPDLMSALGILAAAHLLCPDPPLKRRQTGLWFAILCLSALAHSSNILILLITIGVLLFARLRWRSIGWRPIGLLACAVIVGIGGEMLFHTAVRTLSGNAPVRPPFLMARLIADGPGLAYLKRTCPENGLVLCRHMDGMSSSSDDFLWADKPSAGVFSAVGNDERRRIAGEELRFVLAVAADRPIDVLLSSARSALDQAGRWRLSEFNNARAQDEEILARLPPRVAHQFAGTLSYRNAMPVRPVERLSQAAAVASLAWMLWTLIRRLGDDNLRLFLVVLLIGVVADIVVCGAISTPHDRYLMRVLWLIPLGAAISLLRMRTGETVSA